MDAHLKSELIQAIQLAISADWNGAHQIVQNFNDPYANWIHAVLHKIEGDEFNSRYWYARTYANYEDYKSSQDELMHLLDLLQKV